jgi:hypothetical protein
MEVSERAAYFPRLAGLVQSPCLVKKSRSKTTPDEPFLCDFLCLFAVVTGSRAWRRQGTPKRLATHDEKSGID